MRRLIASIATLLLMVAGTSAAFAGGHKVTICHATGSQTNPYVKITVAPAAFHNAGHVSHEGDVWAAFSYVKHGKTVHVPAQGDQSLLPDCVVPEPEPTPDPTPTPEPEVSYYRDQYEYSTCEGLFRGARLWQVIEGEEPVLLETFEDKVRDLTEDEAIDLGCIELPPPPTDPEPEPAEELAETGAQAATGWALLLLIAGGALVGMRKLALRGGV